jgi:hypothetical protein
MAGRVFDQLLDRVLAVSQRHFVTLFIGAA